MTTDNTVTGRLIAPDLVRLTEPLLDVPEQTIVTVVTAKPQLSSEEQNARLRQLVERLQTRPPGTRTRDEIEAQVQEERDGWND